MHPEEPLVVSVVLEKPKAELVKIADYRERTVSMVSILLGIITAMMTVMVVFYERRSREDTPHSPVSLRDELSFLLPALTVLATMVVSVLAATLLRELRRSQKSVDRAPRHEGREMESRLEAEGSQDKTR